MNICVQPRLLDKDEFHYTGKLGERRHDSKNELDGILGDGVIEDIMSIT